jgi:signal transduction histidine kinase
VFVSMQNSAVSRPAPLLFLSLAAALGGFGLMADRALVREATTSAELLSARAAQDARAAALAVRGALAEVERDLLAGRTPAGVRDETLALSPGLAVSVGRPYRGRPVAELRTLLLSTKATDSGLPEAVVAAVALGAPLERRDVVERLLDGQLPVRPEDLPRLASLLGADGDTRVADLQRRLREVPDASGLPRSPLFSRRQRPAGGVEGWTRLGNASLRYEVTLPVLFERAGVADRASLASGSEAADAASAPVPDVDGLVLAMAPTEGPRRRLLAARAGLWLGVAACLAALALVWRAIAREARAVRREKKFLAGVTHELRTPVAAIRVFGEALADGAGNPREYGALLVEQSQRLEALVERTLASTRVDEAPKFTAVRPGELLCAAVEAMRPAAERRGVTLEVSGIDEREAWWDADAVRRALVNLIENAIKHGRPQGWVAAGLEGDDGLVRLSVRDDGPGIERRDQRRLFGRFERGDTEAPGAGLGLYLVDQVASAHGGRVDLASVEGRGCTFTLVLPRLPPAHEAARRPGPAS